MPTAARTLVPARAPTAIAAARRAGWAGLVLALLCAALGALVLVPQHNASPYVREDIRIPVADGHYSLAVTILRPRGEGAFGAIVLNHGVGLDARDRFRESPTLFIQAASAFVSRGYAVVMPLRRGFGETGGIGIRVACEVGRGR